MNEKELQEIEKIINAYGGEWWHCLAKDDVQNIIAEVRRLKVENEGLNEEYHIMMNATDYENVIKLQQEIQRYKQALEEIVDSREGSFQATTGEGHNKCVWIAKEVLK
jgi:hypothetical protein